MRTLLSREPWRATPRTDVPVPELSEEWGWLEIYLTNDKPEFVFVPERPTDEQIKARRSCR